MSNDTTIFEPETNTPIGDVTYQRDIAQATPQPEFKPGEKPYTNFGNETLNGTIEWHSIVNDIIPAHYTQTQLVTESGLSANQLHRIINKDYDELTFRAGARLLMVHSRFYPEQYA
jgi:hypothetical protein